MTTLRDQMPETAKWIDDRRTEYGPAYVNDCIRRAMAGEAGVFYAFEAGHVIGTPFTAGTSAAYWQDYAFATGCKSSVFLKPPPGVYRTDHHGQFVKAEGATHGAH